MNKFKLGMLAAGSLLLAACSSDKTPDPVENEVRTFAVYNPVTGDLPLPNDLLFSGTTDLTLNVPVADPNDFSDPLNAIASLDGWSTVAPIVVSFANEDGSVTIDPATVAAGSSVHLVEVLADTDFNNPLFGPSPTFAPYSVVGPVPANQYFATVNGGTNIAIIPLAPLNPRSTYVVAVTDGVTDSQGVPVVSDGIYQIVSSDVDTTNSALIGLQGLVRSYENLAAAAGVDKDSIVVSFSFTTQSVGPLIESAKAAYIDGPIQAFGDAARPATDFTPLNLPSSAINPALSGEALVSVGQITLNYYLGAPSQENPTAPLNTFFRGAANIPTPNGPVANPLGGGFTTYVNSLPEVNGQETVPLLVTLPSDQNCPTPYPVVIFQHGITSDRTALLGIADGLAAACHAAVAMDLPLHGLGSSAAPLFVGYTPGGLRERTFGVDYIDNTTSAPGPDTAVDGSGAHFINLANLLVSRDNLRQAILDLLALEKAIPVMDIDGDSTADFDADRISFIGHSLGGIVGSSFTAYSDNLIASVLANPGGGIAGLLDASDTFGPVVRGGVAAASGLSPTDAAFPAVYSQFLLAAQTVIDSGDPINTTQAALANNVPTLMLRNEGDAVVPNNSATSPLSGTDPLAVFLGLQDVTAANPGDVSPGARQISRINDGLHSTVLTPAGPNGAAEFLNVTTEMQTHIISFIGSEGAGVQVVDPSLID